MNDLQPAIEAQGLGRRFGRYWALAHVELAVPQGEALLLAGPNGSGKTTLLRIIFEAEKVAGSRLPCGRSGCPSRYAKRVSGLRQGIQQKVGSAS